MTRKKRQLMQKRLRKRSWKVAFNQLTASQALPLVLRLLMLLISRNSKGRSLKSLFTKYLRRKKEERIARGTGTQDKTAASKRINLLKGRKSDRVKVTLMPEELEIMDNGLPAEKFEFFLMIGNDMVTGMTAQLELFSRAIGKRWMVELSVAASHAVTFLDENVQ